MEQEISPPGVECLIDRLCDHVLLDIFEFLTTLTFYDATSLMTITWVNRRWRYLVITSPLFWTQIDVDEHSFSSSRYARSRAIAFPIVTLYLERSQSCPIDIMINFDVTGDITAPPEGDEHLPFTFDHVDLLGLTLAENAQRIRTLQMVCPSWMVQQYLLQHFRSVPMPMLQGFNLEYRFHILQSIVQSYHRKTALFPCDTLSLFSLGSTDPSDDKGALRCSGSSLYPNIRDVELHGAHYKWGRFCATNLSSLSIGYIPWDHRPTHRELRDILSGSPTLCSLSFSGALPSTGARVDLNLPQLSSLDLGFSDPVEVSIFVVGLDVPSLKKLELHYTTPTLPREAFPADSEAVLYARTADAFNHLIDYLPLQQLLGLSVRNVRFSREESIVVTTSQVDRGLVKDHELPAVLRFVQRLKILSSLHLVNPDPGLLLSLVFPQLSSCPKSAEDTGYNPLVAPRLKRLSITTKEEKGHQSIIRCLQRCRDLYTESESGSDRYIGRLLESQTLIFPIMAEKDVLAVERTSFALAPEDRCNIEYKEFAHRKLTALIELSVQQ
ncbi:uncharacterized protein EV420DRAFT_843273 [Desarmillaria tabescens]|uniref:F-box domain-containing protein n=1 Tax=Armillaria tabescens TaxID=1929756 RepID=A0AA39MW59_ARMTA|nr:uncharacterized protein EV420DRAFT_843273 [Desarmillaria tabescens]KAK0448443.1 hypothetical protein EV420DRAFT_843273 [Desarmillaria tabescens]